MNHRKLDSYHTNHEGKISINVTNCEIVLDPTLDTPIMEAKDIKNIKYISRFSFEKVFHLLSRKRKCVIIRLVQLRLEGLHQIIQQLTQISKYDCVVGREAQVLDNDPKGVGNKKPILCLVFVAYCAN